MAHPTSPNAPEIINATRAHLQNLTFLDSKDIVNICLNFSAPTELLNTPSHFYSKIDWVMGHGFYARALSTGITEVERKRLRLLAGPHGKTLLRVLLAKKQRS